MRRCRVRARLRGARRVCRCVDDSRDRDPRLIDAVKAGDRARVRALLKQPAELTRTEADGTTALHWAVRADDLETVRLLLAAGADVNAATREGITPLVAGRDQRQSRR